jgi:hypothetical protein
MTSQVLIQWSHLPIQLSTWEDEAALRQEFPRAPAWGQADSQGGESVTIPPDSTEGMTRSKTRKSGREMTGGREGGGRRILKPNTRYAGPKWAYSSPTHVTGETSIVL